MEYCNNYATIVFWLIGLNVGIMTLVLLYLAWTGRNDSKDWERIATEIETHLRMRK